MVSLLGLLCLFMIILASMNAPVGASEEFKVGDVDGWRQPAANESSMYTQWAAKNRFHVGDSLRFEYKNDSVLVVDKWGYYHCNTSNPISAFNDGNNSIVNLHNPGPMYFISGDPDHCKNGQRLLVDVMTLHPISHTPPSIASPPQPFPATSPSPSPLSSAGVSVSVPPISVLLALVAHIVALVWCAP
ncbi:early nodulin-like protein 7 [Cornus florida]|uniref:early nodulin-like protein 7 n=1 Tax=Cornus florida TaxID=4283 RepID=UPI0028A0F7E5|nr:early nodulin-like protein 7 [Cornus florida]